MNFHISFVATHIILPAMDHRLDALHRCRHEARCESVDQLDRHGGCFTATNAQAGDTAFAPFLAQGMNQRGNDA
ncbi:hypothetical protein DK37_21770 [Halomonas sp. SUBG004]|nr:hypothetical protein DK37_21770 [Halomonas sp. SUBG004]